MGSLGWLGMGYQRHHAIIVTSWNLTAITEAHNEALRLYDDTLSTSWSWLISPILQSVINGIQTFMVAPDGSKEGWRHSNSSDRRRADFIEWLDEQRHPDDSSPLSWVEVQYGDDDLVTRVENASDARYAVRLTRRKLARGLSQSETS